MILKCLNSDCEHQKKGHNFKKTFDHLGNIKRDDFKCEYCGSEMVDPETQHLDYSNVRMEKPFSDRDMKKYYDRQRKETGKKKTSSN